MIDSKNIESTDNAENLKGVQIGAIDKAPDPAPSPDSQPYNLKMNGTLAKTFLIFMAFGFIAFATSMLVYWLQNEQ